MTAGEGSSDYGASDYTQSTGNQGPSTDKNNDPVIDPTKNVLDLVRAAIERQDDLRDAEVKHLREIVKLRALERKTDIRNVQALEKMRAAHSKELRIAEAERINAIRAVDNQAVQQAAVVSATQATTLASQVAASAEAMRVQVAATANASAIALANALEPITKAIEELRRSQYEAQGKTSNVADTGVTSRAATALWIAGLAVFVTLVGTVATIIIQVVK